MSNKQITLHRQMHSTENGIMLFTAQGRSLSPSCNKNICAQICEYGFKVDSSDCPTCECDNPCAGYPCSPTEVCVAVRDEDCSGFLCPVSPQCKSCRRLKDSHSVINCTDYSPPWGTNSHSACQQIPHFYEPKVHHCIHNNLPLYLALR
jgi:hypothetical protein